MNRYTPEIPQQVLPVTPGTNLYYANPEMEDLGKLARAQRTMWRVFTSLLVTPLLAYPLPKGAFGLVFAGTLLACSLSGFYLAQRAYLGRERLWIGIALTFPLLGMLAWLVVSRDITERLASKGIQVTYLGAKRSEFVRWGW